jgi:hypothetical protein
MGDGAKVQIGAMLLCEGAKVLKSEYRGLRVEGLLNG